MLHTSPISHGRWRIAAIACALSAAMLLGGCGRKEETQAAVGQVIAHVGPDDVTQQELDNELRLANVPVEKRTDAIVKAALTRIVERKYLVQQALAAKLDREPTVHLEILRSREQMLAGAFVQRDLSSKMSTISKNEIDSYIQAHPKQFDKRELFQIEQISFTPPKDLNALAAATKDDKTLDQIESKLNEMNIKFSRGTTTLDSATMPAEMLQALEAKKPDDVFFIRSATSASYFKVDSVDAKPLTGEDADQFAKREVRAQIGRTGRSRLPRQRSPTPSLKATTGASWRSQRPAQPARPLLRAENRRRRARRRRRAASRQPARRRRPKSPLRIRRRSSQRTDGAVARQAACRS